MSHQESIQFIPNEVPLTHYYVVLLTMALLGVAVVVIGSVFLPIELVLLALVAPAAGTVGVSLGWTKIPRRVALMNENIFLSGRLGREKSISYYNISRHEKYTAIGGAVLYEFHFRFSRKPWSSSFVVNENLGKQILAPYMSIGNSVGELREQKI